MFANLHVPLSSTSRSCHRRSFQGIMALLSGRPQSLFTILCCLAVLPFSWALKFDLQAHTGHGSKYERCIRNFVAKDTLVVVTATVSGQKGDGQKVNMHVSNSNSPGSSSSSTDTFLGNRLKMRLETSTESRKISSANQEWPLHPMQTRHSMSASRTY